MFTHGWWNAAGCPSAQLRIAPSAYRTLALIPNTLVPTRASLEAVDAANAIVGPAVLVFQCAKESG